MSAKKVSVIIPCLWSNIDLFKMTCNSLEYLVDESLQIIVIADSQPYTVNVNNGLRAATGDVLIVTNNDVEYVDPNWLQALLGPLEQGYDIMSLRTTDSDGWETEDRIEDDAKFGSIFAMKRAVYETIGGFDEQFRGYFSDLDYHTRARVAGFKIGKNHGALVEHKGKATYKQVDPDDTEFQEAKQLFKQKHGSVW